MKKKLVRLAEVAKVLAMPEADLKAAAADLVIRDDSEAYLPEDFAVMLARAMQKKRAAMPPQQMAPEQEEKAARVYKTNATRELFSIRRAAGYIRMDTRRLRQAVADGKVAHVLNSEGYPFIPRAEVVRLRELQKHHQREVYARILKKDMEEERADRRSR